MIYDRYIDTYKSIIARTTSDSTCCGQSSHKSLTVTTARVMEKTTGTDEDNDQSKPLLGDEYLSNDEAIKTLSKAKVAEYLPKQEENLGIGLRLLRGLYGHLPREDVPRIFWVSTTAA